MNVHTSNTQIIKKDGLPVFAVIPYEDYLALLPAQSKENDTIPQEVAEKAILKEIPLIKAWRLYLNLTQKEVAEKAGITQAALSQMERTENTNRTKTLEKLATALGVSIEQLKD
jgi:DNA-binding XRE family transcriptional regulator